VVVREDATVEAGRSVFFTSDHCGQGRHADGFGFADPASVTKVTLV
jgi:hypothetical protein